MPLYIVRWPNLSATIVRAEDEDQLLDILDEEGNAEGCRIAEYDGPLYVDFELPVEYDVMKPDAGDGTISPEQIRIKSVQKMIDTRHGMEISPGYGETGHEMCEAVMRFAFPAVFKVWAKGEEHVTAKKLERAVHKDALEIIRTAWRRGHVKRGGDRASALATAMDMPVRLAKRYLQQGDEETPPDPGAGPEKTPRKGGR